MTVKSEDDAQYLVDLLHDAHKLNSLFKGAVDTKLLRKVQKDMDAYYAKKKVNKVPCLSYADWKVKHIGYRRELWEANYGVTSARADLDRCEALYRYCINKGGKVDALAARATVEVKKLAPNGVNAELSRTVNRIIKGYAERYKDLEKLFDKSENRRGYEEAQPLFNTIHDLATLSKYTPGYVGSETARIEYRKDGTRTIQTSMGVTLSSTITEAIRGVVADILLDKSVTGRHIASYVIREHSDKWLKVGCHSFRMPFVKKFCELYTLDMKGYKARSHELLRDWDSDGNAPNVDDNVLGILDALQQVAVDFFDENYKEGATPAALSDADCARREAEEAAKRLEVAKKVLADTNMAFRNKYNDDGTVKLTA